MLYAKENWTGLGTRSVANMLRKIAIVLHQNIASYIDSVPSMYAHAIA